MAKTAAELMAELSKNKDFQEKQASKQEALEARRRLYEEDQKGLLNELSELGFDLFSVWDFVNSENNYWDAIPTLINHLSIKHHPRVLSGILRSLAIEELSNDQGLWDRVIEIYKTARSDDEIAVPEERGLQESAAAALEVLASKERIPSLESIIESRPNGDGVAWLRNRLRDLGEQKKGAEKGTVPDS